MGKVYISSGGGGTDLDVVTAAAGDILAGKVIVGPDGEPLNGTLPNRGQAQNAGGWGSGGSGSDAYFAMNKIPEGAYFSNGADWAPEVRMKQSDVRSAIGATNAANWRSNTTIAGLKGTMPEQGGKTVTPKSSNQTAVSANRYVTGNIIVAGDSNLKAANIKKGVPIFGIIGTFEGYIAGAADLYNKGKNAKNVQKYNGNGTVEFQNGFIYVKLSGSCQFSSSAFNTTGYSKLNVHFLADTKLDARNSSVLELRTAANGGGSTIASVSQELGSGEKTFSVSFTHAANAYLYLSLAGSYNASSSGYKAYIDRIWLS